MEKKESHEQFLCLQKVHGPREVYPVTWLPKSKESYAKGLAKLTAQEGGGGSWEQETIFETKKRSKGSQNFVAATLKP